MSAKQTTKRATPLLPTPSVVSVVLRDLAGDEPASLLDVVSNIVGEIDWREFSQQALQDVFTLLMTRGGPVTYETINDKAAKEHRVVCTCCRMGREKTLAPTLAPAVSK